MPILIDAQAGVNTTKGTLHVGAHATAALIVEGNRIAQTANPFVTPNEAPIDRATGYPDVSLRLEDVTTCPEATEAAESTEAAQSLANHDPAEGWLLEIRGDFRIYWEDGTSTTAGWITLSGIPEG